MNALCPVDHTLIPLDGDGFGNCPQCGKLWSLPLVEVIVQCEHFPKPVQGRYLFRAHEVPYAYCSWDCKLEIEAAYDGMIVDLGVN